MSGWAYFIAIAGPVSASLLVLLMLVHVRKVNRRIRDMERRGLPGGSWDAK